MWGLMAYSKMGIWYFLLLAVQWCWNWSGINNFNYDVRGGCSMLFKNSLLVLLPFCFLLGDFTVLHSTLFETTFFCLNADVEHFFGWCASYGTIAGCGYTDDRSFGNGESRIVYLKVAGATENNINFFVLFMAVKERCGLAGLYCPEWNLATSCTDSVFEELFTIELGEFSDRCVGKLFSWIDFCDFVHRFFVLSLLRLSLITFVFQYKDGFLRNNLQEETSILVTYINVTIAGNQSCRSC